MREKGKNERAGKGRRGDKQIKVCEKDGQGKEKERKEKGKGMCVCI